MYDKFERLRNKLHKSIEKKGLDAEETKKISEKLDKLLNSYLAREKQYSHDSEIYIAYVESIEELKRITREFGEFPTTYEWNKYANNRYLLNSEAVKYVSGLNWNKLRNVIKSEI